MNSKIFYKDLKHDSSVSFNQLQLHVDSKLLVVVMEAYGYLSVNQIYTAIKHWFNTDTNLMKYEFPLVMVTSDQIKLFNNYKLVIK